MGACGSGGSARAAALASSRSWRSWSISGLLVAGARPVLLELGPQGVQRLLLLGEALVDLGRLVAAHHGAESGAVAHVVLWW